MSVAVNIFQYAFPVLVVSIGVVLLCFYVRTRRKLAAAAAAMATARGDDSPPGPWTVSSADGRTDEERHYAESPPRYSTVDPPPPYSLFDPRLTGLWPGGSPPAYEMYPITLPLAPRRWATSTGTSSSPHSPPNS